MFFLIILWFIRNRFPVASNINGLSIPGSFHILTVFLSHLQPVLFAFLAEVALYNEMTASVHQDADILCGIVS